MDERTARELARLVGTWDGFEVAEVSVEPGPVAGTGFGPDAQRLVIRLEPAPLQAKRCSRCGRVVTQVHETTVRRVRDLPLGSYDTWLLVPRARVQCPVCGPTVEDVPWLDRYQRMTTRLAAQIARLAQEMTIARVAAWFGVSWDTVKQLDARSMAARLGPMEDRLDGIRRIAIDEFAIHKGQQYVTVVLDVDRKRVVWLAAGHDQASLAGFFRALGPARCAALTAITLDMWRPYLAEVRTHCPAAALVFDPFHIVAKFNHEVVDRVRVDETNRVARAAGQGPVREARRVIKGTRWLLLTNRANLAPTARVRLDELLAVNRALFRVYVLKEDLKQLWRYRARWAAERFWRDWARRAYTSRIPALQRFARLLQRHLHGILSHCDHPIHTGILEGCNNKIKVLKRMAYGYRDQAYFFLKIRAAFPGIP